MLHSGQRGESFAKIPVKILPAFLVVAAETGVDFEKKTAIRPEARIGGRGLYRAANEKRGRGKQRERKRNLHYNQRIAG